MPSKQNNSELFREFEHTGDIGIELVADEKEELFRRAAIAVAQLMVDTRDVRTSVTRRMVLHNRDDAELLHDALSELVALFVADGFIWADAAAVYRDDALELDLFGENFDPVRHPFRQEIKAVTYHQLSLRRVDSSWQARVIFDV